MKVRGKKLTRKQKEALSAQGWDFRLYLCVRDGPDFMELVNRTTGKCRGSELVWLGFSPGLDCHSRR